jgi:multisubunit Na+/H+ antiporter MnhC subunit
MKVPTLPLVLAGIVVGTIVFALVGTLIFRIKREPAKKCEDVSDMR